MDTSTEQRIFEKLEAMGKTISNMDVSINVSIAGVNGRLNVIDEKLTNTVTKPELLMTVASAISEHTTASKDEITGIINTALKPTKRDSRAPYDKDSGVIRISLSGMSTATKYILYVIAAGLLGMGGLKAGVELEKSNEVPVQGQGQELVKEQP